MGPCTGPIFCVRYLLWTVNSAAGMSEQPGWHCQKLAERVQITLIAAVSECYV